MNRKASKSVALAIFCVIAAASLYFVHDLAGEKEVDPASFGKAGAAIKRRFPAYERVTNRQLADTMLSSGEISKEEYARLFVQGYIEPPDAAIGKLLFGKGYLTTEQHKAMLSAGMTEEEIAGLVDRMYVMPWYARYGSYALWAALMAALALALRRRFRRARKPGLDDGEPADRMH